MKYLSTVLIAFVLAASINTAHAQDGIWLKYTAANSQLAGDTVHAIAFDGNNSAWIYSEILGGRAPLSQLTGNTWKSHPELDAWMYSSGHNPLVFCNNAIWGGNFGSGSVDGLAKYDGSAWTTYTTSNSGLIDQPIVCLMPDNKQNLWIGTQFGLNKLTPAGTWTTYTPENVPAMPGKGIAKIATNGNADIWMTFIGTHGLAVLPGGDPTKARFIYQDTIPHFPSHGGSAAYITCLALDWGNELWVGTEEDGVVRIDANGATVFNPSNTPAFKSNNIHSIAVDGCGNVWVGTDAGALRWDGSWMAQTKALGDLPNDTVNVISVDRVGHVWFGTMGGVAEFKPRPQKPYLNSPLDAAVVVTDSVTCKWEWDCPNVLKYWYELAENANFTNSLIDTSSASLMQSMSRWDTILKNHTTYYWRVKAANDAGWGFFSDTWSFNVNKPPPLAIGPASPSNGVTIHTDSITCRWLRGRALVGDPSIMKYWFEIADNANFTNSRIDSTTPSLIQSFSKLNTGLSDLTTYFWRVKAENDGGWGAFGSVWSFRVDKAAGVASPTTLYSPPELMQSFPNPCTDQATISFWLPRHVNVSVKLYDLLGRKCLTVVDNDMGPGLCNALVDASSLQKSGVYVYRLQAGSQMLQRTMQIVR